ncbi:MAG: GerMN domain-containing protein [Nocardioides sp.]
MNGRRPGTVLLSALVFLVLTACLAEDTCACTYPPEDVVHEIYLLEGSGPHTRLRAVEVRLQPYDSPGMVALEELVTQVPPEKEGLGNAWTALGEPITAVRSVAHRKGVVTVDLTRGVWDPYPTVDFFVRFDLGLATQQLVWTVQRAIGTDDPVLLTVRGEPARGVWLHRVEGPIEADPKVLAARR